MLPYRDSRLTIIALGSFFVLVAFYALFEARGQIFGPDIKIARHDTLVYDAFFEISGQALRISKLTMNGHDVSVTKNGDFREAYILAPGYNLIVFDASDSYGRAAHKMLEIIYQSTSTNPIASTSAAGLAPR